ncbi:MAG: hypothetical protein LBN01_04410 [Endomicrobium sp.]|jgi:hypothetical protein|nr:hypothetical protein [Endomicrobium sp.]
MFNEILPELKEKIPIEWLEPLKEESFENGILTLAVPDNVFAKKYETDYKPLIQSILKTKTGKNIGLQFQIIASKILSEPIIIKDEKTEAQLMKKTKYNGKPYFKSPAELSSIAKKAELQKKIDTQNAELISMPNKYGIKDVVSFYLFNSKMFTYPNDRRKKAKVKMTVRFDSGATKIFDLYRGQLFVNDNGYGQLTTTHAKIFLAIIHIWQKQNSRYANNNGYYAVVDVSMRELARQLGYEKVSGSDYRRLEHRIKELADYPMILADMNEAYHFTFLSDVVARTLKKSRSNRLMLRLTLNPFISKQLYERNSISRNPQCYKIKNPTAFKFLLCYDKRIIKGNSLKLEIHEVANDLEISTVNIYDAIPILNTAFK